MSWIELTLAAGLLSALVFFSRFLIADFRGGVVRTRYRVFQRAKSPVMFWLVTAFNALFFAFVFAATLVAFASSIFKLVSTP